MRPIIPVFMALLSVGGAWMEGAWPGLLREERRSVRPAFRADGAAAARHDGPNHDCVQHL